jgi:hypothetical protein
MKCVESGVPVAFGYVVNIWQVRDCMELGTGYFC